MSSTQPHQEIKKSKVIWFALIVVIILAVSILWLLKLEPAANSAPTQAITPSLPAAAYLPTSSTVASITTQQSDAITAAAHATHAKPIVDPVNQRPDFVSEIEWQTLKMIAQKNPNPDQELTRLVSNMRFNKQMEIWQSLANTADHSQRDALATQLLADIPAAVNNQAIDKTEAQKAQMTILTDLEHDPHTRQQRIAQEAARIGIKFEIQEAS